MPADPRELTRKPIKARLYEQEGLVLEVMQQASERWGARAYDRSHRLASLIVRPEAFVRKCAGRSLELVAGHGFTPIAWRAIRLLPDRMNRLWRFQLNKATRDRVALTEEISDAGRSMFLLLRDDAPQGGLPATVRLSGLKGSLSESRRSAHHIRSRLGMTGRTFGFIHTADEPLDVLREIAVLLEGGEQRGLLDDVDRDFSGSRLSEALDELLLWERQAIEHSLSYAEVAMRLVECRPALSDLTACRDRGGTMALSEIRSRLLPIDDEGKFWDYAVLAAELIVADRPGVSVLLDGLSPSEMLDWQNRPLPEADGPSPSVNPVAAAGGDAR